MLSLTILMNFFDSVSSDFVGGMACREVYRLVPICRWFWRWVRPRMTEDVVGAVIPIGWCLLLLVIGVFHSYGKTAFDPQWVQLGMIVNAVLWYPGRSLLRKLQGRSGP